MIKAVFFDLDGTLVPYDNNLFLEGYFKLLVNYLDNKIDNPKDVAKLVMKTVYTVLENDGHKTNKELFWDEFIKLYQGDICRFKKIMNNFYLEEFDKLNKLMGQKDAYLDKVIDLIDDLDLIKVIATSPVFPRIASKYRLSWLGYEYSDFDHITTYENCIYSKPQVNYYQSLLDMFNLKAEEVLMVGNDLNEDIKPCISMGMKVFLIDRFILNEDQDLSINHGTFKDLYNYLTTIFNTN